MSRSRIVILGSAAGGGSPQWNCRCTVCSLYWAGDPRVIERTQSSIAVTGDGENWLLLNCSPDLRAQVLRSPFLQPVKGLRHSPISAVVLTNGDIDHTAGLLSMRELQAFQIYATSRILKSLAENSMFSALSSSLVTRVPVRLGKEVSLPGDLAFELFEVPGKVPLYEEGHKSASRVETTVGVRLSVRGRTAHYIPGCASVPSDLKRRLMGSDVLLFDGTLWSDEELLIAGVGTKTGEGMGHISISGAAGSLAKLSDLDIKRKIYVHINNTNPVLIDGSPERNHVEMKGWNISYDGMEIFF